MPGVTPAPLAPNPGGAASADAPSLLDRQPGSPRSPGGPASRPRRQLGTDAGAATPPWGTTQPRRQCRPRPPRWSRCRPPAGQAAAGRPAVARGPPCLDDLLFIVAGGTAGAVMGGRLAGSSCTSTGIATTRRRSSTRQWAGSRSPGASPAASWRGSRWAAVLGAPVSAMARRGVRPAPPGPRPLGKLRWSRRRRPGHAERRGGGRPRMPARARGDRSRRSIPSHPAQVYEALTSGGGARSSCSCSPSCRPSDVTPPCSSPPASASGRRAGSPSHSAGATRSSSATSTAISS